MAQRTPSQVSPLLAALITVVVQKEAPCFFGSKDETQYNHVQESTSTTMLDLFACRLHLSWWLDTGPRHAVQPRPHFEKSNSQLSFMATTRLPLQHEISTSRAALARCSVEELRLLGFAGQPRVNGTTYHVSPHPTGYATVPTIDSERLLPLVQMLPYFLPLCWLPLISSLPLTPVSPVANVVLAIGTKGNSDERNTQIKVHFLGLHHTDSHRR